MKKILSKIYLLTIIPVATYLPIVSIFENFSNFNCKESSSILSQPLTVDEIKKIPFEQRIKLSKLDNTKSGAMTDIRNQGNKLICWAYALAAASETNILYQPEVFGKDFKYDRTNLNLSPDNIDYKTNRRNGTDDPLGLTNDDKIYKGLNGSSTIINFLPPQIFFQGNAPIWSKTTNYNDWAKSGPSVARIKDVVQIPNNQNWYSNVDEIKKAIAQYGAVVFNYEQAPSQVAYYQDTYKMTHASTIVGWDDTFPKEHFKDKNGQKKIPSRNGAWIVKNSYGPIYNFQGNQQGYFYLSYDSRIEEPVAVNFGKLYEENSNKYYYNGQAQASIIHDLNGNTNKSVANIFPTKKANEKTMEILKSASVSVQIEANAEIIMKIYADVDAELNNSNTRNNDPENGILVYQKKEKILPYDAKNLPATNNVKNKYNVTHTVEIDDEIELKPNTNYSVVFEFADEKGNEFLQSENGNEYDASYVKINNKWELFGKYSSLGVPIVSTIQATTIDKPRQAASSDKNLFNANISTKKYIYDGNNINVSKDDIEVSIDNNIVPIDNYDIQSKVVIDPNAIRAGYLQIAIVGRNGYYGYQKIIVDIQKGNHPLIENFASNIIFDNNTNVFNIELNITYEMDNIDNLINLPSGWTYENSKIIYTNKDKLCFMQTEFDVKIIPTYQHEQISNSEIKIIGDYEYNKNPIIPRYEIWYNQKILNNNNYDVSFENNTNASSEAKLIVEGKGNFFKGRKTAFFTIKKAINKITIENGKATAIYGDVIIKYYKDNGCTEELEQKPNNETYYIKYESVSSENYCGDSQILKVEDSIQSENQSTQNKQNNSQEDHMKNWLLITIIVISLVVLILISILITLLIIKKRKK